MGGRPGDAARPRSLRLRRGGGRPAAATVLFRGLAYKGVPETDDMRGAPVVPFLEELRREGPQILGHDYVVSQDVIESCGAAAAVGGKNPRPVVIDSSTTIAFSGIAHAIACAMFACVKAPVGCARSMRCCGYT